MVIDEKRLGEIAEKLVCLVPRAGVGGITSHEYGVNQVIGMQFAGPKVCDCEMLELIALARLGLDKLNRDPYSMLWTKQNKLAEWAETHALPALRELQTALVMAAPEDTVAFTYNVMRAIATGKEALAALPAAQKDVGRE